MNTKKIHKRDTSGPVFYNGKPFNVPSPPNAKATQQFTVLKPKQIPKGGLLSDSISKKPTINIKTHPTKKKLSKPKKTLEVYPEAVPQYTQEIYPIHQFQGGGWFADNADAVSNTGITAGGLVDSIDPTNQYGVRSAGGALASGALKGAAAGTAILPGIGTVIGGVLGAGASLFTNHKAKKREEEALEKIRQTQLKANRQRQSAYSDSILANYDELGTGIQQFNHGGMKPYPYQNQLKKPNNLTPQPTMYYQTGGSLPQETIEEQAMAMPLLGGQGQPISQNALEIKGSDPQMTDDVSIDGGSTFLDHGEVIKDGPGGLSIFSDTLKPPGSKKTFAELAKSLEKQKKEDDPRFKASNERVEKKIKELFGMQQILNGNSQGEPSNVPTIPGEQPGMGYDPSMNPSQNMFMHGGISDNYGNSTAHPFGRVGFQEGGVKSWDVPFFSGTSTDFKDNSILGTGLPSKNLTLEGQVNNPAWYDNLWENFKNTKGGPYDMLVTNNPIKVIHNTIQEKIQKAQLDSQKTNLNKLQNNSTEPSQPLTTEPLTTVDNNTQTGIPSRGNVLGSTNIQQGINNNIYDPEVGLPSRGNMLPSGASKTTGTGNNTKVNTTPAVITQTEVPDLNPKGFSSTPLSNLPVNLPEDYKGLKSPARKPLPDISPKDNSDNLTKGLNAASMLGEYLFNKNISSQTPLPPAPTMLGSTRLGKISGADRINAINNAARTAKLSDDRVSSYGQKAGRSGAITAAKMDALSNTYGDIDRQNTGIANQEAAMNQRTNLMNQGLQHQYNTQLVQRDNQMLAQEAENMANLLTQGRGLLAEKSQEERDLLAMLLRTGADTSGALEAMFKDNPEMFKELMPNYYKAMFQGK